MRSSGESELGICECCSWEASPHQRRIEDGRSGQEAFRTATYGLDIGIKHWAMESLYSDLYDQLWRQVQRCISIISDFSLPLLCLASVNIIYTPASMDHKAENPYA